MTGGTPTLTLNDGGIATYSRRLRQQRTHFQLYGRRWANTTAPSPRLPSTSTPRPLKTARAMPPISRSAASPRAARRSTPLSRRDRRGRPDRRGRRRRDRRSRHRRGRRRRDPRGGRRHYPDHQVFFPPSGEGFQPSTLLIERHVPSPSPAPLKAEQQDRGVFDGSTAGWPPSTANGGGAWNYTTPTLARWDP